MCLFIAIALAVVNNNTYHIVFAGMLINNSLQSIGFTWYLVLLKVNRYICVAIKPHIIYYVSGIRLKKLILAAAEQCVIA